MVISADEIDEPLANEPPRLVDFDWDGVTLKLFLDRPVTPKWIWALQNLGSFGYVIGKHPSIFTFNGEQAFIQAQEHEIQSIIDRFKTWLPAATRVLKQTLEQERLRLTNQKRETLRREKEREEARLRVTHNVRI